MRHHGVLGLKIWTMGDYSRYGFKFSDMGPECSTFRVWSRHFKSLGSDPKIRLQKPVGLQQDSSAAVCLFLTTTWNTTSIS